MGTAMTKAIRTRIIKSRDSMPTIPGTEAPSDGKVVLARRGMEWRVEKFLLPDWWVSNGVKTNVDPDEWRELPEVPRG